MPQVCRTCLEETPDSNCISLNNSSFQIKEELRICLPELDVELVPDAVMCIYCVNELHSCFDFKQKCLFTEKQIRSQLHSQAAIDLAELKKASEEEIIDGNDVVSVDLVEPNLTAQSVEDESEDDVQMEVNGNAEDETVDSISIEDEDDEDDTDSYSLVLGLCESAPRKHPPSPSGAVNTKVSTNSITPTNGRELPNISKNITTSDIQDMSTSTNKSIRARRSSSSNFSCSICSATMAEVFDYIAHTKMAHKGVTQYYKCCKCLYTTKAPNTLMKHFESQHKSVSNTNTTVLVTDSDVSITDQEVSVVNPKTSDVNKKMSITNSKTPNASHSSKLLKCHHCDYVASDTNIFNKHIDSHILKCNKCYYVATNRAAYQKHLSTHSLTLESDDVVVIEDDEDVPCNNCSHISKGTTQHEKHCMITHGIESPHVCRVCGYTACNKAGIVKHSKFHEGNRQHHCSFCSYNCDLIFNLKKHVRSRHANN